MDKLIPAFSDCKLKLYQHERLVIENYYEIKEITSKLIIIDKYNILGNNLKVNYLSQFVIEIYGKISEIVIK